MKKVLLLLVPLVTIGLFNKVNAQCTPYNFQSILTSLNVVGSTANATLDVSFDIKANNGSKYIFLHLWTGSDFANVTFNWGASGQKAPTATDLNGPSGSHPTLLNIGIDNSVSPQVYKAKYVDGTMDLAQPGTPVVTHLANGADSFVIRNVQVSFPASKLLLLGNIIQGAIWSSNSNNYSTSLAVQCFLNGATFLADPVVAANSVTCSDYSIQVTHNSLTQNDVMSGTLDVYVDNGDGLFSSSSDIKITGPTAFSIIASSFATSYYTGSTSFVGNIPSTYKGRALFAVITVGQSSLAKFISPASCASLPVLFQSFSATRNNQSVSIKWETATEINNRGFYIQRNVNGEWKDVAFVFSKADGGNSNQVLSYAYNDPNALSTVSYYRILQVDLDGRAKFSDTRIIKGLGEVSKLLMFPNPGTNGTINVMLQDEVAPKNIIIYDATGRAVKSFKNFVNASLTIDRLKPGVYNIQVINTTTQVVSSDKFIIKD